MTTVCGIDLAAGRGRTEVAALDVPNLARRPRFSPVTPRAVAADGEIVAAVVAAQPAVVAIDAPLTLPAPVAAALRGARPPAGSPYLRAAERDPLWSALGVRPLPVSFLGGLTFRAVVLRAHLAAALPEVMIVETFPSAVLRVLNIVGSGPRSRRLGKTTPARRGETQDGLARWIEGITTPVPVPLGADLLDALAAALAAVAVLRGADMVVGDPSEGLIVLPERAALARACGLREPNGDAR